MLPDPFAPVAFFLTAHFSQEDYPYDWCVPYFLDILATVKADSISSQANALALEGQ